MNDGFSLSRYECQGPSRPQKFWRVTYPRCRTLKDSVAGFVAQDTREILDEKTFKEAADDHFKWEHVPSRFISVFSEKQHARLWAEKRQWRLGCGLDEITISEIETEKLAASTYIFEARSLASRLRIRHDWSEHEYIFLHRIPRESITSTQSLRIVMDTWKPEKPEKTEKSEKIEEFEETGKSETEEQGTCDTAASDRTSSADRQTDLARGIDSLQIMVSGESTKVEQRDRKKQIAPAKNGSVLGESTIVKQRDRKKPITQAKNEPVCVANLG